MKGLPSDHNISGKVNLEDYRGLTVKLPLILQP